MERSSRSSNPGPSSNPTHRKTDTALHGKATGGERYLTDLRSVIAREMADEILQCNIDDFLDHYAPWQVPTALVTDVCKLYVDDNQRESLLVKKVEQDNEMAEQNDWVFANFETEPTKDQRTEPQIFKDLKEIVDSLHGKEVQKKLARIKRTPNFSYRDAPYKDTASEIGGTNFRVDAYLTEGSVEKAAGRVNLADVAVAAEFKKHLKDKIQNRHQFVAGASQILNNDPCRTWIYGFTIENTMMSIWHFSRSHTVVSIPFDFTKDIRRFIHVFLSLIYAERTEIGYDPTIHRVEHKEKIQYVYEVRAGGKTRYFRTEETLFTSRVLCISGRKTRVWKAVEVEGYVGQKFRREKNGGKEVALKDYWLDEGSKTEKDVLEDIFCRLEKVKENPTTLDWITTEFNKQHFLALLDTGAYKNHFMGIECDMALATTKSRLPSAQPVPDFLKDEEGSVSCPPSLRSGQATDSLREMAYNVHHKDSRDRQRSLTREYRTKRHYRLIYEQVGYPLHAATNLHSSLKGLLDTLVALTLLYLARYVHRDVSTGNIILVEGPNGTAGKLSDLEYAKVFEETEPSPDPKTGTLFFMAYEIHAGKRLYIPPRVQRDTIQPQPGNLGFDLSRPKASQPITASPSAKEQPVETSDPPKFRFSHDLESLLWVTLFILADRIPRKDGRSHEFVKSVFVAQNRPSRSRERVITMDDDKWEAFLVERIHPDIASFVMHLASYRYALLCSYTEKDSIENMLKPESYSTVYETVLLAFQGIRAASQDLLDIKFEAVMVSQQPRSQSDSRRKRQRTQEEHDDDDFKPGVSTESRPLRKMLKRGTQSHVVVS